MDLIEAIGQIIRMTRVQAGLTQQDLAANIGMHVTAISRIERADRLPRIDTLEIVASELGLSLSELIRQAEQLKLLGPGASGRNAI